MNERDIMFILILNSTAYMERTFIFIHTIKLISLNFAAAEASCSGSGGGDGGDNANFSYARFSDDNSVKVVEAESVHPFAYIM